MKFACVNANQIEHGKIVFFTWENSEGWPILYVSNNVEDVLDYSADKLMQARYHFADLVHPDDLARVSQEVQTAESDGREEFSHESYRIKASDGQYHHIYDHTRVIRDSEGNIEYFQGYIFDQTETVVQSQRFELVLEGTALGLWDWNPQTNEVVFDERWANMLGFSLDEIEPSLKSWESRVHPDDLQACYADIQAHIEGKVALYENIHRMMHKDGKWRYILDRGKVVERDAQGEPIRFTGTHTDVTALKEAELALKQSNAELERQNRYITQLAKRDGLTNLFNRRSFDEQIQEEWRRLKRNHSVLALVMIDVDNFKLFNDNYGHQQGDDCLIAIAKVIDNVASRSIDFAARYGGEEFVIILPDTDEQGASILAEELLQSVRDLAIPHPFSKLGSGSGLGEKQVVSCSAGLAVSTLLSERDDEGTLIRLADEALYKAKNQGRDQLVIASKPM